MASLEDVQGMAGLGACPVPGVWLFFILIPFSFSFESNIFACFEVGCRVHTSFEV